MERTNAGLPGRARVCMFVSMREWSEQDTKDLRPYPPDKLDLITRKEGGL